MASADQQATMLELLKVMSPEQVEALLKTAGPMSRQDTDDEVREMFKKKVDRLYLSRTYGPRLDAYFTGCSGSDVDAVYNQAMKKERDLIVREAVHSLTPAGMARPAGLISIFNVRCITYQPVRSHGIEHNNTNYSTGETFENTCFKFTLNSYSTPPFFRLRPSIPQKISPTPSLSSAMAWMRWKGTMTPTTAHWKACINWSAASRTFRQGNTTSGRRNGLWVFSKMILYNLLEVENKLMKNKKER
jgi:hypothetical protein